jgi:hypothetical protein
LQYFINRYYDGYIDKFASVYPMLFNKIKDFIGNPQELSSYAYAIIILRLWKEQAENQNST